MVNPVILCVDDEKIILDSIKAQLKRHFGNRFVYEIAGSADEALEIIEELVQDGKIIFLIISDWLMPGIKGDEFLEQVHQKYPKIIKILLTGQASGEAIEKAYQLANLHRCLHKPWSDAELLEAIESALGGLEQLRVN
jgi:CheY-like chemotaxis protein